MTTTIIGIDPGQDSGLAVFENGALVRLMTLSPLHLIEQLHLLGISRELANGIPLHGIVMEDSRKTSHSFTAIAGARGIRAQLKIARNVGMVDGQCALIEQWATIHKVPLLALSPEQKGQKLDAARFKALTGWAAPSNQHQRDAAVVAWRYRNGWKA